MKRETVKPMPPRAAAPRRPRRSTPAGRAPRRSRSAARVAPGDADELADHEAERDREGDPPPGRVGELAAAQLHPGVGEREERQDREVDPGMEAVFELAEDVAAADRHRRGQQRQGDARQRRVDPRLEGRHPDEEPDRHVGEDPPHPERPHRRHRGEPRHRQRQPAEAEVVGVGDGDDEDRGDVVDHGDRHQEELHADRRPGRRAAPGRRSRRPRRSPSGCPSRSRRGRR